MLNFLIFRKPRTILNQVFMLEHCKQMHPSIERRPIHFKHVLTEYFEFTVGSSQAEKFVSFFHLRVAQTL